jgi:hypothetical protein
LGIRFAGGSEHCDRRRNRQTSNDPSRSMNLRSREVGGRLGGAARTWTKDLIHNL